MRRSNSQRDTYLRSLGEVIRDLRTNNGMSQQELADMVGAHRTYISDIERGARNLTVVTLCHIADALETPLTQLLRIVEDRQDLSAQSEIELQAGSDS